MCVTVCVCVCAAAIGVLGDLALGVVHVCGFEGDRTHTHTHTLTVQYIRHMEIHLCISCL